MPLAVLGDRASFYQEFMVGCKERHGEETCKQSEHNRINRIRTQPLAVVNYTAVGYTKIRTPPLLFQMIQDFWNNNRHYPDTESWDAAVSFTYVRLFVKTLCYSLCGSNKKYRYSPVPFYFFPNDQKPLESYHGYDNYS